MNKEAMKVAIKLAKHERWRWEEGMVGMLVNVAKATADVTPNYRIVVAGFCHASAETATISEDRVASLRHAFLPLLSHPSIWGWMLARLIEMGHYVDLNGWMITPIKMQVIVISARG